MVQQLRISSTQKTTVTVLDVTTGLERSVFFSRRLKPLCGDYVTLSDDNGDFRIDKVLPRENVFSRADSRGRKQHLASNIDQILIIMAVNPAPTRDIINRYLIAAELNYIEPIIVFNKVDLDSGLFIALANDYRQLDYQVYLTSIHNIDTVTPLRNQLKNKTTLLAGQSGVGKSSLSNILFPELNIKTGVLAKKTGKGAHTTSVTQLHYDTDTQAALIDSPGVWEYGLWSLSPLELASGFCEFQEYLGQCKFSDCSHSHEPGCAIVKAVANGKIKEKRYASFIRICQFMKHWQ